MIRVREYGGAGRRSGLERERSKQIRRGSRKGKGEYGWEWRDRRYIYISLRVYSGRSVKERAGKRKGKEGRGRWEPLKAGTKACRPHHPKAVPCTGPGAQEVLRRHLLCDWECKQELGSISCPSSLPALMPLCAGGCRRYLLSCSCSSFSSPSCSFSSCSWCWTCSLVFWSLCLRLWEEGEKKEGKHPHETTGHASQL